MSEQRTIDPRFRILESISECGPGTMWHVQKKTLFGWTTIRQWWNQKEAENHLRILIDPKVIYP